MPIISKDPQVNNRVIAVLPFGAQMLTLDKRGALDQKRDKERGFGLDIGADYGIVKNGNQCAPTSQDLTKMTQDPRQPLDTRQIIRGQNVWRPPTDVYETDGAIVVQVEIAGVTERDFEITIVGRRLVVKGTRLDAGNKLGYHNAEILYGHFRTEVRMPWQPQEDAIEASYENGFLYVRLPKARRQQIRIG